jgi:hypothetical protein
MKRSIVGLLALTLAAFSSQAAKADRFEDILKGVVRIARPLDVPRSARRTRRAGRASTSSWPAGGQGAGRKTRIAAVTAPTAFPSC